MHPHRVYEARLAGVVCLNPSSSVLSWGAPPVAQGQLIHLSVTRTEAATKY